MKPLKRRSPIARFGQASNQQLVSSILKAVKIGLLKDPETAKRIHPSADLKGRQEGSLTLSALLDLRSPKKTNIVYN